MKNIEFSNCMQVIEIIGILPNRVCVCGSARSNKLMDLQLSNYFPSETEGAESKDWGVDRTIHFWGTEIPKWFNYQSVEISIFFWLGRKFPKLVVCIPHYFHFSVYMSINGCEKCEIFAYGNILQLEKNDNLLCLFSPSQRRLQQQLDESNPTDQNHVQI